MRRSLRFLLLIALLFLMSGCMDDPKNIGASATSNINQATESHKTEQTLILVEPDRKADPVKENTYTTNISKDHVPEFLELFAAATAPGGLLNGYADSGYAYDEAHCYNVTPAIFSYMTDMKIFKFSNSCASFLMLDREIYPLCQAFGGFGFVDAILWDFDEDGNPDLLVSSSWGSGTHCSVLSVFNTATKESVILYAEPGVDLYASCSSPASSAGNQTVPCSIRVNTIKITAKDLENFGLADLSWTAEKEIGYVYTEGGAVKFFPWELNRNINQ